MSEKLPQFNKQRIEKIPIPKSGPGNIIFDRYLQIAKKLGREQAILIYNPKEITYLEESGVPVRMNDVDGKFYAHFNELYDSKMGGESLSSIHPDTSPTIRKVVEEPPISNVSTERPRENPNAHQESPVEKTELSGESLAPTKRFRKPSSKVKEQSAQENEATDYFSFVRKKLSQETISAIKNIPPIRKEIFDSNYVPQATLKIFKDAGFIAEPFFEDGKQYIWIRDTEATEGGVIHSDAVKLLREIVVVQEKEETQKQILGDESEIAEEIRGLEAHLTRTKEVEKKELIEPSLKHGQKDKDTVITDEGFLEHVRKSATSHNIPPPSLENIPTLTEEVEVITPGVKATFDNLMARVNQHAPDSAEDVKKSLKSVPKNERSVPDVPTLPLSDVIEKKSTRIIPPIVITALRNKNIEIRPLPNGQVELTHQKNKEGNKEIVFVEDVSFEEALGHASSKVSPKLASYKQVTPSLSDPMVKESVSNATELAGSQLAQLSGEAANRGGIKDAEEIHEKGSESELLRLTHENEIYTPIVGETAERLTLKSKVLNASNEDVEDAIIVEKGNKEKAILPQENSVGIEPEKLHVTEPVSLPPEDILKTELVDDKPIGKPLSTKRRLSREESLAYVAEKKALKEIPEPELIPETITLKEKKEHLDNAESIRYINETVPELRKRQKVEREKTLLQLKFEELPVLTDVVLNGKSRDSVESLLYPSSIDIELPLSEEKELTHTNAVDIPLPLGEKISIRAKQLSSVEERKKAIAAAVSERKLGDIKNEIAFLEKVKSEVSSGSNEFIEFAKKSDPQFKKAYEVAGGEREALAHMWIEEKLQSLKLEKEGRKKPEQAKVFDERFTTEFGITKEALSVIDGFEKLSPEQQKLVYGNLAEYAHATPDGYLHTVWSGILNNSENHQINTQKKTTGGMETYKPIVSELIKSTALYGPKMHEDNEGNLIPDLVHIDFDRKERGAQYEAVRELNIAAHELAKIPREWLADGIDSKHESESRVVSFLKSTFSSDRKKKNKYETAQKKFARAQHKVEQTLRASGKSDGEIARTFIELKGRVHQLQFIQTAPESVRGIEKIQDKNVWNEVAKKMFSKSSLGYMALGFVGRTATVGFLGFAAAPTVSAGIAGLRAWNRSAAELRERDRAARMGVTKDKSAEALNMVQAVEIISVGREKRDRGMIQKTQTLIAEYNALNDRAESNGSERIKVLDKLKTRVIYIQDKLNLNRVNFGKKEDAVSNMVTLYETLAEAQMIVADNYDYAKNIPTRASKVEARLEEYLGKKEEKITRARRTLQIKETAGHALRGGVFALGGALLADYVRDNNIGGKIKDWVSSSPNEEVLAEIETDKSEFETETRNSLNEERVVEVAADKAPSLKESLSMSATVENEEKISSLESLPAIAPIPTIQSEVVASNFDSPTQEEKEEVQKLFASNVENFPNPTALDIQGGRILETYFLSKNVPMHAWQQVRDLPVKTFTIEAMERGTFAERTPALAQLGKIFREVEKPPYGVKMFPNEKTEIYMHRVFTAITQANNRGLTTDNLRSLLGNTPNISRT